MHLYHRIVFALLDLEGHAILQAGTSTTLNKDPQPMIELILLLEQIP